MIRLHLSGLSKAAAACLCTIFAGERRIRTAACSKPDPRIWQRQAGHIHLRAEF